ncbi:hypothetical protein HK104_004284 [Borealophlyctis nickersoniae]|nr:hypothetical protein HK104_004284 [Borealophlyctis nickersoniae]
MQGPIATYFNHNNTTGPNNNTNHQHQHQHQQHYQHNQQHQQQPPPSCRNLPPTHTLPSPFSPPIQGTCSPSLLFPPTHHTPPQLYQPPPPPPAFRSCSSYVATAVAAQHAHAQQQAQYAQEDAKFQVQRAQYLQQQQQQHQQQTDQQSHPQQQQPSLPLQNGKPDKDVKEKKPLIKDERNTTGEGSNGGPSRKRTQISNSVKRDICEIFRNNPGMKHADLAAKFGCSRPAIVKIIKDSDRWIACSPSPPPKRQRLPPSKYPQLESALSGWYTRTESSGLPVTDEVVRTKAKEYASVLGIREDEFRCSDAWVAAFKRRCRIQARGGANGNNNNDNNNVDGGSGADDRIPLQEGLESLRSTVRFLDQLTYISDEDYETVVRIMSTVEQMGRAQTIQHPSYAGDVGMSDGYTAQQQQQTSTPNGASGQTPLPDITNHVTQRNIHIKFEEQSSLPSPHDDDDDSRPTPSPHFSAYQPLSPHPDMRYPQHQQFHTLEHS